MRHQRPGISSPRVGPRASAPLWRPHEIESALASYRSRGQQRPCGPFKEGADRPARRWQMMEAHTTVVLRRFAVVAEGEYVDLLAQFDQLRRQGGVQGPDSPLGRGRGRVLSSENPEAQT